MAEGDDGAAERAAAAAELWALRGDHAATPPFDAERDAAIFASMSELLEAIFEIETAAVARLATIMG